MRNPAVFSLFFFFFAFSISLSISGSVSSGLECVFWAFRVGSYSTSVCRSKLKMFLFKNVFFFFLSLSLFSNFIFKTIF